MKPCLTAFVCFAVLIAGFGAPGGAAEPSLQWKKLADPPADPIGRECPPGMDAVWIYVPEWKGFLLYGGFSPTYSNAGWFFRAHPTNAYLVS